MNLDRRDDRLREWLLPEHRVSSPGQPLGLRALDQARASRKLPLGPHARELGRQQVQLALIRYQPFLCLLGSSPKRTRPQPSTLHRRPILRLQRQESHCCRYLRQQLRQLGSRWKRFRHWPQERQLEAIKCDPFGVALGVAIACSRTHLRR